jgi:uncharacterized protein (DUF362 family)/NAD-dependent dihydropyrimidine dehydrogenase PreA subunit
MLNTNNGNPALVSIAKAANYDYIKVYEAVRKCLGLIGGLDKFVKQGDSVFVKINHLSPPSLPERGIVTHPVFLQAVLALLIEAGADTTVGDDIDSGNVDGFSVSGIRQVCEKEGIRLVNLRESGFVETRCDGLILDRAYLSRTALDADVIINLPKLKTHALTVFTGGIKNMYGVIPKGQRTRFHYDYMKIEDFSQMLTDVFSAARPHLTIMDGIMAMEGEGPSSGHLRNLGVILASQDAVALDAIASKIIGLGPSSVLTTRYASERGLGTSDLRGIKVVGESIGNVAVSDYKLPAAYSSLVVSNVPSILSRFLLDQMVVRPRVIKRLCTGCLECINICPAGAVSKVDEIVEIDESKCIHCMCCHEVCRFNAIVPRRRWFGSLINSIARIIRRVFNI